MMTKKHFEAIAKIVNYHHKMSKEYPKRPAQYIMASVAEHLAYYLREENPSFDKDRFYQACGFEQGVSNPY